MTETSVAPRNFPAARASLYPMLSRRILLTSLVPALGVLSDVARAQTDDPADDDTEKKPPLFERLFPVPTGTNGFEEIIRAGQRLGESQAQYLSASEFTLDKKRAYLADPACREAIAVFRRGIVKPLRIPADDPTDVSLMQSFALVRSLTRLLSVDMYVAFADGKSDAAIRTAADGLRLSYSFKGVSMIAGLVGAAMDAILLTTLAQLRENWNVRDCERLTRLAGQWLAAPDPIAAALSAERELALRFIREWRANPEQMYEQLESEYAVGDDEPETARSREAETAGATLRNDPAVRDRVFGEMSGAINEYYDRAFALAKNPTGRMAIPPAPSDPNRHPITRLLRESFLQTAPSVVQRSVDSRLQLQLLAAHAGIRGYRWQYSRLPKTLDELKLPAKLLTDPFTAKPLLYEPDAAGFDYKLASAGALVAGEEGKPDFRERITLPRAPRKP